MHTKRICLALDLVNDAKLIEQYEHYHQSHIVWPEIVEGIKACNILNMEIYRIENRLFMILETKEAFDLKTDFEKMASLPKQKEWAELMRTFQQQLPFAKDNEYWSLMNCIFRLNN